MKLRVVAETNCGLKRDNNQDSFLLRPDLGLYIVADGMGGHFGGEVASKMAVDILSDFVEKNRQKYKSPRDLLIEGYSSACKKIYDKSNYESTDLKGMGTTMVAIYHQEDTVWISNVGDSRAYFFSQNLLWQITEDHSLINEQLRAGIINSEQARLSNNKNVITRSVGYESDVMVDVLERSLVPGDKFILCSDGLSGLVSAEKISEILKSQEISAAMSSCIQSALQAGGDDNVTVLIAECSVN
jgi:serine/threonine protein phosphatase PrpC